MEINILQLKTALRGVLNAQLKYIKEKSNGGNAHGGYAGASMMGGPELTIKLAKRNGGLPHLCLDVKEYKLPNQEIASLATTGGGGGVNGNAQSAQTNMIGVHHALPVRMMRVEELQYHVPPRLGMPDVQLELPRDRPLKNVVDRLRSMSPHGEYQTRCFLLWWDGFRDGSFCSWFCLVTAIESYYN